MSDAAKTDFIVKIGYDQNSNGELNLAEYIEVVVNDGVGNNLGIPTIRGINQAQYASDSDDIDEMIGTGVMSIGTGLILPHESISNRGLLC
ncbi:MAG: hypothetical protein PHY48_13090 [Candidatus Cloacimonetes bacterium]|nr:hypothetical protein [Candidatus Cloacimonadota bacterium]